LFLQSAHGGNNKDYKYETVVIADSLPNLFSDLKVLTPWSRVLPEKPTDIQLFKKFPAFYGTRRFITVFTKYRHLSLS
jgi:hypothetical protein